MSAIKKKQFNLENRVNINLFPSSIRSISKPKLLMSAVEILKYFFYYTDIVFHWLRDY